MLSIIIFFRDSTEEPKTSDKQELVHDKIEPFVLDDKEELGHDNKAADVSNDKERIAIIEKEPIVTDEKEYVALVEKEPVAPVEKEPTVLERERTAHEELEMAERQEKVLISSPPPTTIRPQELPRVKKVSFGFKEADNCCFNTCLWR